MKIQIKRIAALSVAALFSANLFALDASGIESARQAAWSGLEAYNAAYKKIQSASSIIRNLFSMRDRAFGDSASLEKRLKAQTSSFNEIKADAKVLSATFEKNKKFLDSVKGELKSAADAFKSEQKRFAYADEINAKLSDLSSKNPGKNYQDKRYADRLSSEYLNAKENFKNAQNNLSRLIIDADIANPRISGISSMLALSYTFLKKASDEIQVNTETLAALEGEYKLLETNSLESLQDLNVCINKLRDVKMQFLSQYMDLLSAMGSQDKIFKANPNIKDISISPLSEIAYEPAEIASAFGKSKTTRVKDSYEVFGEGVPAGAMARSAAMAQQDEQDSVRVEFLQIGKNLSDLTREINEATMLMRAVISEAESAIRGITRAEGSAKAVLQNAIAISTEAQLLNSDIAIFKSGLGVTSAQFEVSISNFKSILANFVYDSEACLEKSNLIKAILAEDEE